MTKTAVGSPRSDKKKRAPFFGTFGLTDGSVRGSGRHARVPWRRSRPCASGTRRAPESTGAPRRPPGSLPSALLGLGLRVRGWLRLGSIVGCHGLGLGVGLRGFHLLGLGLRLGRGYSSGKDPSSRSRMSPALGRIGAAPVAMAPSALGGHCETFAKQSFGSRACFGKRGNSGRNVERSTEALDEAETLLGPRIPRGASSDHHDRIGHTRVRRPRRLRRTGVRRSGCVVRSTRVSLSTSLPAIHPERALFSCDRHPGHPTSFHVFRLHTRRETDPPSTPI